MKCLYYNCLFISLFFMILSSQMSLFAQRAGDVAQLPIQKEGSKGKVDDGKKNRGEAVEGRENRDKQNADRRNRDKRDRDKQTVDKKSLRELMDRAEEHFFHQRYNVALRLFELVIKRDPENARAYRFAGDAYLLQGKWKEAEEYFHVARELSKQPQEEWFRIAQVKILSGDGKGAEKALKKALALKPDMHLCHFYLGIVAYRLLRDKEKTISHWENYIKSNPSNKEKVKQAVTILRDKDYVIPYSSPSFPTDDHPPPSRYNK